MKKHLAKKISKNKGVVPLKKIGGSEYWLKPHWLPATAILWEIEIVPHPSGILALAEVRLKPLSANAHVETEDGNQREDQR